MLQQGIKNQVQGLPVFVYLTVRKSHLMDLGESACQRRSQSRSIDGSNRGVTHNQGRACARQTVVRGGITEQSTANDDAIATLA